jgi:hypothetical protein
MLRAVGFQQVLVYFIESVCYDNHREPLMQLGKKVAQTR